MNKRLLIGIVSAAGVLLLATLILFIIALTRQPAEIITNTNETPTPNTNVTTTNTTSNTNTNETPIANSTNGGLVLDDKTAVLRVIGNFTERFGSYSTDTNYENVELSRSLMTDTMSATADAIIQNSSQQHDGFYSVESRVINTTLTDYSDGATGATAEVSVRQTTISGQANPQSRNTKARLTLVKVDTTWKVDSFSWTE